MTFGTLLLIIALAIVVTVAMVLGSAAFSRTRLTTRLLHCPESRRRVAVEFVELVADGRAVDVAACSTFGPGHKVTCDKRCLDNRQGSDTLTLPAAYI
jgi:hypothetical protein